MEENVVDLEKAIKVIGAIPEKGDQDDDDDEKEGERSSSSPVAGTRPAASLLPTVLGESSDKLSKMLKNVLQDKVSPTTPSLHLLHLMSINKNAYHSPTVKSHIHTFTLTKHRTTLTSSRATERQRSDLYFYSKRECL